jgi:hypothetical protein
MDFSVYVSGESESTLLLVPACFLPPLQAQVTYGPLFVCGRINSSDGGAKLWRRFAAEIEDHDFAAVSMTDAARILGKGHPFLDNCRKTASTHKSVVGTSPIAPEAQSPAGNV